MTRPYIDWPETLDVRMCDRHHWSHDVDEGCPLCRADVPPLEPEPDPAAMRRAWAMIFVVFAMLGVGIWTAAWWLVTPTAEQAEALARVLP